MAIPKQGSRPIIVDGTTYRWYMRRKATYHQLLIALEQRVHPGEVRTGYITIAVEHAEARGYVLAFTLPQVHPNTNMGLPVVPVVPSQVARVITQALAAGWQPTKPGKPFTINVP